MGFNSSSGTVNVTGNVNAVISNTGTALSVLNANRTTAGSTTIGTVGAGKKWRVYSMSLCSIDVPSSGTTGSASLLLNSIPYLQHYVNNATSVGYYTGPIAVMDIGPNYVELTEGQTIVLTTGGNGDASATILYVEVNV